MKTPVQLQARAAKQLEPRLRTAGILFAHKEAIAAEKPKTSFV
jgi:hypothetical protein